MQRVPDGEVSSYLADDARSGDSVEVRGPVGGWFVWKPEDGGPVLLVAGGSGVVPLMAMIRSRDGVSPAPFRLIYSMRSPKDRIYDHELRRRAIEDSGLDVTFIYTRTAPDGEARPVGRITADDLLSHGWAADLEPTCTCAGRLDSLRVCRISWLASGTTRAGSRPSGSGPVAHDHEVADGMNEQSERVAVYDGNTLAGPLSEVFAVEVTTAIGRCRSCGTSSQLATFRVYGPDPGFVGRCPHCEDVLLRLVRTPDALWLDFSGVSALRISMPADSEGG